MKPLRLEFQAFGSYPNKEVVDFTVLARRGLFVVTGPTGTGKSTIFDAMVYALYGELPGSRGGTGIDCRSQHAPITTETYVQFDFEVDGVVYRVMRKPTQERAAKRGGGTATENADASLVKVVGGSVEPVAARVTPVTDRCKDLIGLDASQFQRVVLLPQGAFTAFLLAGEMDREKLLRPLFGGEVYQRATEWLKGEMVRLDKLVEKSDTAVNHHLSNAAKSLAMVLQLWLDETVEPAELEEAGEAAMQQRVDGLAATGTARRAALDQVQKHAQTAGEAAAKAEAAASLFDSAGAAQRQLDALEAQADEMVAQRQLAQQSAAARPVVEAARKVDLAEQARVAAQAMLDQLQASIRDSFTALGIAVPPLNAPAVSAAIAQAEQQVHVEQQLLAELDAAEQALRAAKAAVDAANAALVQVTEAADAAAVAVAERQREVDALGPVAAGVEARSLELQAAGRALADRERLHKAEQAVVAARSAEAGVHRSYVQVMARFVATQAPRLAETLVDGEPCPVCGSQQHPSPAHDGDGDTVDQDAVDAARAALATAGQAVTKAQTEIDELTKSLGDAAGVEVAVLQAAQKAAAAALTEAKQAATALGKAQTALSAAQKIIVEAEERKAAQTTAVALAVAAVTSCDTALSAAQDKCAHVDRAAVPERVRVAGVLSSLVPSLDTVFGGVTRTAAELGLKQAALAEALDSSGYASVESASAVVLDPAVQAMIEAKVSDWDADRVAAIATVAAFKSQDVPLERPDAAGLRSAADDAVDAANRAAAEFTTVSDALKSAGDSLAAARKVGEDSAEERRQRDLARTVFRTCNGEAGFKVRLERWVLARELERVTQSANVHLGRMSNGRYALKRDSTKGGLRLEVHDSHTGKSRATNSLSGGEQFQASLSLALGLADVVSHGGSASGKHFEALFVDEGFGSLDQDALTQAIDALEQIHASGRMVGAITHVEEMKQRLHRGIEVSRLPNDSGSTLRVNP